MGQKIFREAIIVPLCIAAVLLIWNLTDCATVRIGNKSIDLSLSDSWRLRSLLLMQETDFIEYGCGFPEDPTVKIGGLTYRLAMDDCNSVYVEELDFYYKINKGNQQELHKLLSELE